MAEEEARLLYSEWETKCESGVALVTTLLLPEGGACVLKSFIRWHLAVGFERIYLCFDGDETSVGFSETQLDNDDRVQLWTRGGLPKNLRSLEKFGEFQQTEVQARQVLNAEAAARDAQTNGFRWLVHLDIDEAFYIRSRGAFLAHFQDLDKRDVTHFTYANHEGVPETEARDYFSGVRLFKRNHLCVPLTQEACNAMSDWKRRTAKGQYLLCYDNGKSSVRLVDGIKPTSVHGWAVPSGRAETALVDPLRSSSSTTVIEEPCILHFVVCGLFWFETKYKILGAFPDSWFGGRLKIAPSFHLDARDVVQTNGDLHSFYHAHVSAPSNSDVVKYLNCGVCKRYDLLSDFLKLFPRDSPPEEAMSQPQLMPPAIPGGSHNPSSEKPNDDALRAWILSSAAQKYL